MRQGAYKLMKNKLSYNFYKFKYKKNEYLYPIILLIKLLQLSELILYYLFNILIPFFLR